VDFLLVLIELFFARCYGWGAVQNRRFLSNGAGWPKISG